MTEMVYVFCLVLKGGDLEDLQITLSGEKAFDWLENNKKHGQILEYTITDDGISSSWRCIWEYNDGVLGCF
jgi:hypothetical protein